MILYVVGFLVIDVLLFPGDLFARLQVVVIIRVVVDEEPDDHEEEHTVYYVELFVRNHCFLIGGVIIKVITCLFHFAIHIIVLTCFFFLSK